MCCFQIRGEGANVHLPTCIESGLHVRCSLASLLVGLHRIATSGCGHPSVKLGLCVMRCSQSRCCLRLYETVQVLSYVAALDVWLWAQSDALSLLDASSKCRALAVARWRRIKRCLTGVRWAAWNARPQHSLFGSLRWPTVYAS